MKPAKRMALHKIRLIIRILMVLGLLVFFFSCQQARAIKLLAPTWFGMQSIASGVYVDKAMPAAQREEILKLVSEAEERVSFYYGNATANPKFLFCSSQTAFEAFGGAREAGLTVLGSACVFSPRGLSTPIMAHEWSHAEFYSRIGLWHWLGVPRWFDEGLAVIISEEPRHSESVYRESVQAGASPPLTSELKSFRQWSRAVKKYRDPILNPGNRALVYATVGHEVKSWFDAAGTNGLQQLCKDLGAGVDFAVACSNSATHSR